MKTVARAFALLVLMQPSVQFCRASVLGTATVTGTDQLWPEDDYGSVLYWTTQLSLRYGGIKVGGTAVRDGHWTFTNDIYDPRGSEPSHERSG